MLEDRASVADVLVKCFGRDGDITVVVGRGAAEDSRTVTGKRTAEGAPKAQSEFRVWSPLLCAWSDVFAAMFAHDFAERATAEVVIEGFSAAAVEAFLRFMYSGVLECGLDALIEVAGLADKYDVAQLRRLCEQGFQRDLTPQNACEMLELADRGGVPAAKQQCLEFILRHPREALPHAHVFPAPLMEEVLASPLLVCISDSELATILLGWGVDKAVPPERISALLEQHVQLAALTKDERRKAASLAATASCGAALASAMLASAARLPNRGKRTADLFLTLFRMYEEQFPENGSGKRPPFLGYWVNLIPSAASFGEAWGLSELQEVASNQYDMSLAADEEVSWMLPHHAVLLTGVSFAWKLDAAARVEVHVSRDGVAWHCVLDSGTRGAAHDEQFAVFGCRSRDYVRWFKLRVREGSYENSLVVRGYVQAI